MHKHRTIDGLILLTMLIILSSLIALNLEYPAFALLLVMVSLLPIILIMVVVIGKLQRVNMLKNRELLRQQLPILYVVVQ